MNTEASQRTILPRRRLVLLTLNGALYVTLICQLVFLAPYFRASYAESGTELPWPSRVIVFAPTYLRQILDWCREALPRWLGHEEVVVVGALLIGFVPSGFGLFTTRGRTWTGKLFLMLLAVNLLVLVALFFPMVQNINRLQTP